MTLISGIFLFVILVLLFFGLYTLLIYNGLVRAEMRSQEAWSGIVVQLKRKSSLIPNLLETVKGYASHERETLENVTRARGIVQSAKGVAEISGADNMLSRALGRLFAVMESYPDLKASENFISLQAELTDIEEKIAYARQFYNRNVLDYNTRIKVFPQSLIASLFGFGSLEFIEEEEGGGEVKVHF